MKALLLFIILFLLLEPAEAQMHSRLIATVSNSQDDSVHYTYSGDRGAIFNTVQGPFPYTYRIDQYDSFDTYFTYPTPFSLGQSGVRIYDSNDNILVFRSYTPHFQPNMVYLYIDSSEYDANNSLVKERIYNNSLLNPIPVLTGWTDNIYNGGLLVRSTTRHFSSVNVYDYTYNSNKQLISSRVYDSADTKLMSTNGYGYNTGGQLTFEATGTYDSTGTLLKDSSQKFYTYNGSQVTQVLRQGFLAQIMTNIDKTDYNYVNGLLVDNTSYTWSMGQWVVSETDSNTYNGNKDKVLSIHTTYNLSGQNINKYRTTRAYDTHHNVIYNFRERYYTVSHSYENDWIDSSTYDQLDQVVDHWWYAWIRDSSKWFGFEGTHLHNYYEYFWPASVAAQKAITTELILFPSPAQNLVRLQISTKEKQHCTFSITDMQGRLHRQWADDINGTTERSIPVNDLPNGNYIVNLVSGNDRLSKKFSVAH